MKTLICCFIIVFNMSVSAQDTLTILYVNDTHSTLAPLAPRTPDLKGTRGGIARAASIIGLTKMTEKNVLTLHGGDVFVGDLFFNNYFGAAEFQIMNSLGFDAMVVGNHEFDLMPSTLLTAFDSSLSQGGFDVLSANTILEDPQVQPLKKYIKPYTIKSLGGIKVGIFGMTSPTTNYFSLPSPAVIDTNLGSIAGEMVSKLSGKGCNLIIMLSHLGVNLDELIAANVPGINIIVGAHDHLLFDKPREVINPSGSTTYIVQANSFYSHIGQLKVILDNGTTNVTGSIIPLDENVPEEPTIAAIIDNLIQGIESTYGQHFYTEQIGYATRTFNELADPFTGREHSTDVGNLVTDAFRNYTGTDIAITVGGSTSQPLYEGPIVAADVFRMIGYGFNEINGLGYRLTTFKLKGSELLFAIQACLAMTQTDDELVPQVSGMKYQFYKAGESLVLESVTIKDAPVDPQATYTVTTNEFLSYALPVLVQIPLTDLALDSAATEFEVVLAYIIGQGGNISPSEETKILPVGSDKEIPEGFNLKQNYPNPFNPSTIIEFSLHERGNVTLKIYDMLGRELTTLVKEQLNAGTHRVIWNASGFASGVYFYQLTVGSHSATKKLHYLK